MSRVEVPFDGTSFAAVRHVLGGDSELTVRVLSALAANMERDEQYHGTYGPLRAWRVAGPWQVVNR